MNELLEYRSQTRVSAVRYTVLSFIVAFLLPSLSVGQPPSVDFRYAPARYQTIVCMPGDWQKTMVSEQGALTYDYGPGPYARPLTEISVGVKGARLTVARQYLEDAQVPVVTTIFQGEGQTIRQEAFALAPENSPLSPARVKDKRVTRSGGFNGCANWAVPPAGTDPAFRNVAWGTNRPIKYKVRVEPGSRKTVAMGLCESYKWGPGTRIVELRVEGAAPLTVSTMKDSIKNRPYVYLFRARDENGDGELTIESHASPKSPDPNVILNAFWVFRDDIPVREDALVRGELSSKAEVCYSCGTELESEAPSVRIDAMRASFSDPHTVPVIRVRTRRNMHITPSGELRSDGQFFLYARPKALSAVKDNDGWMLELPAGQLKRRSSLCTGTRLRQFHLLRRRSKEHSPHGLPGKTFLMIASSFRTAESSTFLMQASGRSIRCRMSLRDTPSSSRVLLCIAASGRAMQC